MGFYRMTKCDGEESALLVCKCNTNEHSIELSYFNDEIDRYDLYVQFRLNARGFWNRLWTGIRYIFGYKSRYGDFGEMIIDVRDAQEIVRFLNEWIEKCIA